MNRAIKLLNLAVVIVVIGASIGCDNDGSSGGEVQALTENDFSEDPSVFAEADRGIVVDFLESPDSEQPVNDTGDVGTDIVPYRYTRTLGNTFCWEDENLEAGHFMILVDNDGAEVLRVEVNGECVTEVIEEGDYEMQIFHDGLAEETHPIFIEVVEDTDGVEARKTATDRGFLKTAWRILSETMRIIGVSREARAQTVEENVQTLLTTGECEGCDLRDADLFKANLTGAKLDEAWLSGANLFQADLATAELVGARLIKAFVVEANLTGANLRRAILQQAELQGAVLREANLFLAALNMANLEGADLSGETTNLFRADLSRARLFEADLSNANLFEANLFLANLTGADLTEADLTGAFLEQANLESADLTGANLRDANLTQANLTEANLAGARMIGAIVSGTNLTGANLEGALWINGNRCLPGSIGMCIEG